MLNLHSHTLKMGIMIGLVMIYFLVELVAGHLLKSITLTADAFHMLSDFIALIIGIAARRISKWPKSSKNTFGWQRAEVVGTLLNTVMLTTLTFTILIKSIQRFIEPEEIKGPNILLWVGLGGLAVNILGLIILRNHHGHSHGAETAILLKSDDNIEEENDHIQTSVDGDVKIIMKNSSAQNHSHNHSKESSHMNMKAVFLHVLADFFGSVAVVVSALILCYVPNKVADKTDHWKMMIDPLISMLMVALIWMSTVPLLKKSALILLQSVPKDVSIQELKDRMEQIEGIEKVHDLHVWLLQSDVIIGTVHIRCSNENYVAASKKVKNLFHDFKIHCTTIQAEFAEHVDDSNSNNSEPNTCVLYCDNEAAKGGSGACNAKQSCCPTKPILQNAISNNNKLAAPSQQPMKMLHQESAPCLLISGETNNPGEETVPLDPCQQV